MLVCLIDNSFDDCFNKMKNIFSLKVVVICQDMKKSISIISQI